MDNFEDWFNNKLRVDRFPVPTEIVSSDYDIIINVSDEHISTCLDAAKCVGDGGIDYFWFPLTECDSNMGLNSIFAAMQILYEAEGENRKVLLHCHAGANRSPMIADCYYFMRIGMHRPEKKTPQKLKEELNEMFGKDKDYVSPLDGMNCLQMNCYAKHLPPLEQMEIFLSSMVEFFEKDLSNRGGALETCKLKLREFDADRIIEEHKKKGFIIEIVSDGWANWEFGEDKKPIHSTCIPPVESNDNYFGWRGCYWFFHDKTKKLIQDDSGMHPSYREALDAAIKIYEAIKDDVLPEAFELKEE